MISWRTATIALAIVCCIQRWQSCTRAAPHAATAAAEPARHHSLGEALVHSFDAPRATAPSGDAPTLAQRRFFGFRPPAWAAPFLPQPGETMRAYRERIVPIAEIAIAPQRARVARLRDKLDPHAQSALDAAAGEAAAAIEDRITNAVLSGELQALKPMAGVTLARDVLDIVDRGNAEFVSSLTAEQRAASTFDFADYLLFSTRWEDALPM